MCETRDLVIAGASVALNRRDGRHCGLRWQLKIEAIQSADGAPKTFLQVLHRKGR